MAAVNYPVSRAHGESGDQTHVTPSLTRHAAAFGHAPDLYSSDRGFFNDANIQTGTAAGVTLTCIPQAGGQRNAEREALEHSLAFKKGQRFRAGIEGRISVLFRGRGMKRALVEGRERFDLAQRSSAARAFRSETDIIPVRARLGSFASA